MSRHRWKILAAVAVVSLAGCVSVDQTQTAAQADWVGHNADEFFLANGAPQSEFPLSDGGKLAHWSSGVHSYAFAGTSSSTGQVIGNSVYVTTTTTPGGAINTECQIDIDIGPDGRIRGLRIAKDTIGDWQLSRCREFLKLKVRS